MPKFSEVFPLCCLFVFLSLLSAGGVLWVLLLLRLSPLWLRCSAFLLWLSGWLLACCSARSGWLACSFARRCSFVSVALLAVRRLVLRLLAGVASLACLAVGVAFPLLLCLLSALASGCGPSVLLLSAVALVLSASSGFGFLPPLGEQTQKKQHHRRTNKHRKTS